MKEADEEPDRAVQRQFVDSARSARLTLDTRRSIVKRAREKTADTTAGTIPRCMKEGMKHVISGNTLRRGPICC
jgi:hypothetical protein